MHLLSTRPGGHVEDDGLGVVRVAQTPGDIVVLTVADTTLSLLAEVASDLPGDFLTLFDAGKPPWCNPRKLIVSAHV